MQAECIGSHFSHTGPISFISWKLLCVKIFSHGSFPEVGEKQKTYKKKKRKRILQGLGVGPGSATERWPCRKNARKSAFFLQKIKIT